MRIAVLGPLEVQTDDGVPLTLPGAKERLLLALLTAEAPRAVTFDALAESLWDGDLPATARKSLQIHIVRLRSSLEPDRPRGSTGRFIARRGPGYALTVPRDAVDALRIDDLAARGRGLLTSGDPEEAARELAAAVDLWRGEPYADWPDAPFAKVERRRLSQVHAGVVAGLLEARLQLGASAEVLPQLEGLVAEDPLREDWWRLLMLALYRAGRQADALAAGRRARALLAEEIGSEPGPGLRAMEAAILAQDPALDAAPRTAPEPGPDGASPAAAGSVPVQGAGRLRGGRRAAVPRARAARSRAWWPAWSTRPSWWSAVRAGPGKSSAVRAGLIPALVDGGLPGSQWWRPVIVTPGRAPVDALADLTGDPPPPDPVLLVVDQFEELWAPGMDPAERTALPRRRCRPPGRRNRDAVRHRDPWRPRRSAGRARRLHRAPRGLRPGPAAHGGRAARDRGGTGPVRRTAGGPRTRRRRRRRRPRAGRRAAPGVDRPRGHVGTASRRPPDTRRLPRGGRRRRRANRSAEAVYGALDDAGRESPAGCSCGSPTPTTAARWSAAECRWPSSTWRRTGARPAARWSRRSWAAGCSR